MELKVGPNAGRKVLKSQGLRASQLKSFKPPTTDFKHGFGFNENLLKDSQNQPQKRSEVFIDPQVYNLGQISPAKLRDYTLGLNV